MRRGVFTVLTHCARRLTAPAGEPSDRELVERFAERGDAEAFAALVRRHGAMVLGVCKRVLRHEQDAEDVFQATFLVLGRKAASLRAKEAVGPWLFGVARRLALRARCRARERPGHEPPPPEATGDPLDELSVREARAVLDEELARLPERERGPLVLCYLEGLTRDEAAARLGCPLGTLKSRLERGRALLQRRLARRGVGLPAVLATLLLTRVPASGLAPELCAATVQAATAFASGAPGGASARAAALAEEALRPAVAGKFAAAALAVLAVVACGVGAGLVSSPSPEPRAESSAEPAPPVARLERGTDRVGPPPAQKQSAAIVVAPPAEKPPKEEKAAEPLPTRVSGVAKAVDAARGTLLVTHGEGEDTFTAADGATIEIDGQSSGLARLPAGANVTLTRFVGPKTAGRIQASGRAYFGSPVKAVDPQKGTITIKDRGEEKTHPVAPNAWIWVDGKAARLAAVPPGSFVNLELAADQQTARSIGADGPNLGGCGGGPVKAVDVQTRTITFDKKASPDVAGKTFPVAADALVTINGNRQGALSDVPAGCYVNLLLRTDGKTVGHVWAQGPSNLCEPGGSAVKAVDAASRTITFDAKAKAEVAGKTFTLAKDAIVAIDGKPGTLAAVPPGSVVDMRLWVDRQTVGQINATGPPVPGVGVVTAVDAERNTVTVGDKTYPVAKDANIQIGGKPARLAGVPVGVSVSLRLNVDQKTVSTIHQVKP